MKGKHMNKKLLIGWMSATLPMTPLGSPVHAQTCPAIGSDSDCGMIITITDSGATVTSTGQGPFDDDDDTLVGIVNKSSLPVRVIGLKATDPIFEFDGDGLRDRKSTRLNSSHAHISYAVFCLKKKKQ